MKNITNKSISQQKKTAKLKCAEYLFRQIETADDGMSNGMLNVIGILLLKKTYSRFAFLLNWEYVNNV